MSLFIVISKKKGKSILKENNRGLWLGFEKNVDIAHDKAKELDPDKEAIFYSEIKLRHLIYLLPLFNTKEK